MSAGFLLLLIVGVVILARAFVVLTRAGVWQGSDLDTPVDSMSSIFADESDKLGVLQRRIDELGRSEDLPLQHVRDLSHHLLEVYGSRTTTQVQRSQIEADVRRALAAKRVCWDLEVNEVHERTVWACRPACRQLGE